MIIFPSKTLALSSCFIYVKNKSCLLSHVQNFVSTNNFLSKQDGKDGKNNTVYLHCKNSLTKNDILLGVNNALKSTANTSKYSSNHWETNPSNLVRSAMNDVRDITGKGFVMKYIAHENIANTSLSSTSAVALGNQVINELASSYEYFSKCAWFDRNDVALKGFASYFYKNSKEEILHAKKLVNYLSLRCSATPIDFASIQAPRFSSWNSITEAIQHSLNLEIEMEKGLNSLIETSRMDSDRHLESYLINEFLDEQLKDIAKKTELLSIIRRLSPSEVDSYDRNLLKMAKQQNWKD